MRQELGLDGALRLVEKTLRRFEAESGAALAPVFYVSVGAACRAEPPGEGPSVRLEWLSEASQFGRAARAMQPLLGALRRQREIRGIVLVECEEDFDGTLCKGESWYLEFVGRAPVPARLGMAASAVTATRAPTSGWSDRECRRS